MLKLWLPLLGDFKQQGCSDIIPEIFGNIVSDDYGKLGKCVSFDGTTGNYIRIPPMLTANSEFSIAFWCKFSSLSHNHCLYSQRTRVTDTGFTIFLSTNKNIMFDAGGRLNAASGFVTNTWYHVCCCRDSNKTYIYINGVLAASRNNATIESTNVNGNYSLIGGSGSNAAGAAPSDNYLEGCLNDYRIYDNCLSAAEVHELSQGLFLHYKLNGPFNGIGTNLLANSNRSWTCTKENTTARTTTFYLVSDFDVSTLTNKTITVSYLRYRPAGDSVSTSSGGVNNRFGAHFSVTWTNDEGEASTTRYPAPLILSAATITDPIQRVSASWTATPPEGYTKLRSFSIAWQMTARPADSNDDVWVMGYPKLEIGNYATAYQPAETEGNVIVDNSGYGNHGTVNGDLIYASDSKKYSAQTYIGNGTAQSVTVPNIPFENFSEGTLSIWINRKSTNSNWRLYTIFSNGYNWTGKGNDFIIIGSTGGLVVTLDCCSNTYGFVPNLNEWNMYTITWNLVTHEAKMYVNGKLRATKNSERIDTTYASKHNLHYFGNRNLSNSTYTGDYLLSDARIYATELSEQDVMQLYNTAMKVDNVYNAHIDEIVESESQTKLLSTGTLMSPGFVESGMTFNETSGWSYNPTGGYNSTTGGQSIVVDFSPLVDLHADVTVEIECDLTWSNFTPVEGQTPKAFFQGTNQSLNDSWVWSGNNYTLPASSVVSLMTADSSGTVHYKVQKTIPASWFDTYKGSHVSFRVDYATGTITLSNYKITIANSFKILQDYIGSNEFIEI